MVRVFNDLRILKASKLLKDDDFQKAEARKLQKRLENLGAQPFFRLGLGDDQHDFGSELRILQVNPLIVMAAPQSHATQCRMMTCHECYMMSQANASYLETGRLLMVLALQAWSKN